MERKNICAAVAISMLIENLVKLWIIGWWFCSKSQK